MTGLLMMYVQLLAQPDNTDRIMHLPPKCVTLLRSSRPKARARLDDSLLAASERTRKRRLEAMEAHSVPLQQNVHVDANVDANDVDAASESQEDDLLAFLGV